MSRDWALGLALFVGVLMVYQPAWDGKPIWDDDAHLIRPSLRSLNGLERIWFQPGATQQYYPLVYTVFWIGQRLWSNAPLGFHLINIVLHLSSALLLVRILRKLEIPAAWLAAALWAFHPVQVESVAWMSELKNTLSGFCYFASALAYLEFDENRKGRFYVASLGLFGLGLLAKSVIATMPAALLLVFWWRRNTLRWKEDVIPLAPFFAAGIGMGLFTAWFERAMLIGMDREATPISIAERCLVPGRAFWFYLGKLVWPHPLIFTYPRWEVSGRVWWQYLYPATALLLAAGLWCFRRRLGRGPLVAVLFFAGTLFPALGFLDIYPFRFSFVADHFQYLACLGPLALAAAGIERILRRAATQSPFLEPCCCAGLLSILGALSCNQCGQYTDIETLWRSTLADNPGSWMAHENLGNVLAEKGDVAGAIAQCRLALAIRPDLADCHTALAVKLSEQGAMTEAIAQYRQALDIRPDSARARYDLANTLIQQGDIAGAIVQYRIALRLRPNELKVNISFANALLAAGHPGEAAEQYRSALRIAPANADAEAGLGMALFQRGQTKAAIDAWQRALAIQPDLAQVQNRLAWILATSPDASLRDGQKAVSFAVRANEAAAGKNPIVLGTLAAAYAETGRYDEAAATARKALNLAEAAKDAGLADALQEEIQRFAAHRPMRESK
jgi:protein O-mannosyl-transferase